MSHRMSVLSRRFRSFAIFFSFATLASFVVGVVLTSGVGIIFTSNTTHNEAVFFFAALVSLCFFAAFFLWLARGFAWAMVPREPVEEEKLVEEKPVARDKPMEASAEKQLRQEHKPVEEKRLVEESKPADVKKLVWEHKPTEEEKKLVWEDKPAEEKEGSEEGALYNIAGKRIN